MFAKFAMCAAAAALVSGCAGLSRARNEAAQPLAIRGDLVDLTDVKIFINGDKVIDDQVSLLSGAGDFHGTYAGKAVTARCSTAPARAEGTRCVVSVDDASTVMLVF